VGALERYYDPTARVARLSDVRRWLWDPECRAAIDAFVATDLNDPLTLIERGNAVMRAALAKLEPGTTDKRGERNVFLLHTMALVEELTLLTAAPLTKMPLERARALDVVGHLLESAQALGLLSNRELLAAQAALTQSRSGQPADYVAGIEQLGRVIDWARARVTADLWLALGRYEIVEPRARGVIDDVLRSSLMLPLAALLDRLSADAETMRGGGHRLVGVDGVVAGAVRGENPGLAVGPLVTVTPGEPTTDFNADTVALLPNLPPDLPPVAGIVTLGPTSSLSHISLLARNLGIPLLSVAGLAFEPLRQWLGQDVVLGVSAGRRVLFGRLDAFDAAERQALAPAHSLPAAPTLELDVKAIDRSSTRILPLKDITAADKNTRVGAKSAELARLRQEFPEQVADGVVIPFGAFIKHVDRPGQNGEPSPLARFERVFTEARALPSADAQEAELAALAALRQTIAEAPFVPGFAEEVEAALATLGPVGVVGVFVRSDTNIEDLPLFIGAGLNRTVPNCTRQSSILEAIRTVWASPFADRALAWRRRVLKNPQAVLPAVLLHRTVPAEISGVMVTADLSGTRIAPAAPAQAPVAPAPCSKAGARNAPLCGKTPAKPAANTPAAPAAPATPPALTVSASEGVAAVVDGGSPETVVLEPDGKVRLLASSRSATRKVIPPRPVESVWLAPTAGRDVLLGEAEIAALRQVAATVLSRFGSSQSAPWNLEFGFASGKLWLMQLRPLAQARNPAAQPPLATLDSEVKLPVQPVDLRAALAPTAP
jgi:hypothetical protein